MVVMLPFDEHVQNGRRIRTFSHDTDASELIWHRDAEDRVIHVLESDGWYFQRDEELPIEMHAGDKINVPRCQWHRVLRRGTSRLVVEIITS